MRTVVRILAVCLAALALSSAADAARVPAAVSSIRIRSATGITTTVILPGGVRRIVQAFDALPKFVARPCPRRLYTPPDVSFDFRAPGRGVVVHAVAHAPGTCSGSITYSTKGQVKYAPLAADNFVAYVSSIVGDVDPNPRTAANERLALEDAARRMRFAVAPPGSRRLTTPPKELTASGQRITAPQTSDRIWKVRMSVPAVYSFERTHRPPGSSLNGVGMSNWRGHVSRQLTFSFPAIRNRVSLREFFIDIVPLRNSAGRETGWTGIRIGASYDWVLAHDPDAVVPSGVRTIEIRKGHRLAHRVTTPRRIATIIRWFDALPVSPPAGPCGPFGAGAPPETIVFISGTGHVLARASAYLYGVDSTACTPINFSVGGRSFPPLLGGRFLIRVEKLLR